MGSDEQQTHEESIGTEQPHSKLALFFYERKGSRYYLRFTRLAVILIVGLTAVSLVAILIMFLINSRHDASEELNINIVTPSPSPRSPNNPVIKQAPASAPLPQVYRPSQSNMPASPALSPIPGTGDNDNEQVAPQQTPSPQPSTPPP